MKTCVFTIVRDEAQRLPIWLRYYTEQLGTENVIVLDNDSEDGSTAGLDCRVIPVHSPYAFDHQWLLVTVQWWFGELLRMYDTVIFTECDEILWHPRGLLAYSQGLKSEDVTAVGYEILHLPDKEQPLDLSRPIAEQRKFWFRSPAYSKTLIGRHTLEWCRGFHRCFNKRGVQDQELLLIHLHRMDYGMALELHEKRAKMHWSPQDLAHGTGAQNRFTGEVFDRWFFNDRNENELQTQRGAVEEIPENIRSRLGF